jgi:hypothetical protein
VSTPAGSGEVRATNVAQPTNKENSMNLRSGLAPLTGIVKGFAAGTFKYESRQISDLNNRVYGNTTVVTGRSTQKGAENGRDYSGEYRFTRVYVKTAGKWQTVALQATRIES